MINGSIKSVSNYIFSLKKSLKSYLIVKEQGATKRGRLWGYDTSDKPGGEAVVELLFPVSKCFLCHDLEVEDEHDHQAILVLHRHHVHHTHKALTCRGRGRNKT